MAKINGLGLGLLILLLIPLSTVAQTIDAGADRIVIRAERDDIGGFLEQQAVVFDKDRVKFSRNSNFMCDAQKQVALGYFYSAYTPELTTDRELVSQARDRVKGSNRFTGRLAESPHQTAIYLGRSDITDLDPYGAMARRILEDACGEIAWKAEDAALIQSRHHHGERSLKVTPIVGDKKGSPHTVSFEDAECVIQVTVRTIELWKCKIPEWGQFKIEATVD